MLGKRSLLSLVCAVLIGVFTGGCTSVMDLLGFGYSPPEIELKGIEVKNVSLGSIKLDVRLQVENPNTFDLKVYRMEYHISALDKVIGRGLQSDEITIPRSTTREVRLPLELDPEGTMRLVTRFLEKPKDEILAQVFANVEFDTPMGRMSKDFSQEKALSKLNLLGR